MFRRKAPDTAPQQSAPVQTSADQCRPVPPGEPEWEPLIIGTLHSTRERATLLIEALIAAGLEGKAVYHVDLETFHHRLCAERGWAPISWLALCRELGKLLRKVKLRADGERLTMYQIAKPPANVVQMRKA